ncbi:hypothetical protein MKK88_13365 [Methylobacterium sp. E-005]|uniref:hypothetical protein n=1 Tax=Methylobacterium sp. E-005 TaxID=2836549 RepID=UPI001FBB7CDF|nr:hypothetical protein [Methylobacterium sp. E-005]MCJ2086971.1 hypothetical protein [Methylobacterium sp. E-005]
MSPRRRLAWSNELARMGHDRSARPEVREERLAVARCSTVALSAWRGVEVRHGDILVLRTTQKLPQEKAAAWSDELIRLCAASGVTDVTVLILDNAAELTVERPATRLVQQHREFPQPMQGC